jgi:hypothetical protein
MTACSVVRGITTATSCLVGHPMAHETPHGRGSLQTCRGMLAITA